MVLTYRYYYSSVEWQVPFQTALCVYKPVWDSSCYLHEVHETNGTCDGRSRL